MKLSDKIKRVKFAFKSFDKVNVVPLLTCEYYNHARVDLERNGNRSYVFVNLDWPDSIERGVQRMEDFFRERWGQ